MRDLLDDLRHGCRLLVRSPGLTAAVLLSLALGCGANALVFSLVHSVLLRPLPFPAADRLVVVWSNQVQQPDLQKPLALPDLIDFRAQNDVFTDMGFYIDLSLTLSGDGHSRPERVRGARVSANLLALVGVEPMLGRAFRPEEDTPGRDRVVILGHEIWRSRYGGDRGIVGRAVRLDGAEHEVVGVMPPGFDFPLGAQVWGASGLSPEFSGRDFQFLRTVARLAPGVSPGRAQRTMSALARRLASEYPDTNTDRGVLVVPLREQLVGDVRPALLVFAVAVAFVLLIACANIANLLLARATQRGGEIAVRAALGAGRRRIVRQLLVEGFPLALLGGALGLLLALGGLKLLVALGPGNIPRLEEARIDGPVLAFTLALSLLTGLLFGAVPALGAARPSLTRTLREGTPRAGGGGARRLGRLVVVAQVALALMLAIGAGLLLKSFARLLAVDPGFRPERVLTAEFTLPVTFVGTGVEGKYADPRQTVSFHRRLLERLEAIPEVRAAGITFFLPLSGRAGRASFLIDNRPPAAPGAEVQATVQAVSPGFFPAMGIPLLRGRLPAARDDAGGAPVVVVNQAFVRRFFPDQDPLGRSLTFGANFGPGGTLDQAPRQVVGVVGDVRAAGLDAEPPPEMYFPVFQSNWRLAALVVRTAGDPAGLAGRLREEVARLDGEVALAGVKTLEQRLAESVARPRFNVWVLGTVAGLALVLASIGIYGLMAYSVSRRRREIGIRIAMGARRGDVLRQVVGEGMLLTLIGVAIGTALALALTRLLASLLFGVSATDPAIFLAACLGGPAIALLASLAPALAAARLDPVAALRYE